MFILCLKPTPEGNITNVYLCSRFNGQTHVFWYTQWQTEAASNTPLKSWTSWSEPLRGIVQLMGTLEQLLLPCPWLYWGTRPIWTTWDRSVTWWSFHLELVISAPGFLVAWFLGRLTLKYNQHGYIISQGINGPLKQQEIKITRNKNDDFAILKNKWVNTVKVYFTYFNCRTFLLFL